MAQTIAKVIRQCALGHDLSLFDAGDATEVGERGVTLRFVFTQLQKTFDTQRIASSGGQKVDMSHTNYFELFSCEAPFRLVSRSQGLSTRPPRSCYWTMCVFRKRTMTDAYAYLTFYRSSLPSMCTQRKTLWTNASKATWSVDVPSFWW